MHLMRQFRRLAAFAVLAGVASLATTPAQAAMKLSLSASSDGGASGVTITDNGIGDLNPTLGVITFSGAIGQFAINVTTGVSKPFQGSASQPDVDVNSLDSKSAGSGADTLTIKLTDTGFQFPSAAAAAANVLVQNVGGTLSGSLLSAKYQAFTDPTNAEFGTGGPATTQLTFSGSNFSGSSSSGSLASLGANPFSITLVDIISAGAGAGTYSGDHQVLSNPEPGTMAMIAAALPVLGVVWARRRKAQA